MSTSKKKALVLGVTGQDGSYLTELLLAKGYEVHGLIRKSTGNTVNIRHLIDDGEVYQKTFFLHRGDLADATSIFRIVSEVFPDEIYNEADQDHVAWSYDMVDYSSNITGGAVARILETIRIVNPSIRYFQPCTSNMFGLTNSPLQDESTPFDPRSPYAVAKTFAYYVTRYYRETFGIHASVGILYNHESPRRTPEYVTRKITQAVARIAVGSQRELVLGDLSARIDWGYAPDFMLAAWKMLQQESPDDFVIATGEAHSVEEFVNEAFANVGLEAARYVKSSPSLLRPTKTAVLIGNYEKAKAKLAFEPSVRFKQLVKIMVNADLEREKSER